MDTTTTQPLFLYSTTVSDVGTVRSNNQDSSFAGEHLAAICDGMGGHAGGDTASTIAIRSLAHIEHDDHNGDVQTVASMMETSVMAAHDAIVGKAKRERRLAGMGTTVTAVALVGGYWVVAHIGDSRAYLLRDGRLTRMTQDHSYVQHLINTGRITESEARNHPQRNVVMRVLGDFDIDPQPDIAICAARPADRWLLCSDGLCGVLEDSTIEHTMSMLTDQQECAQRLVAMSLNAGSTDNVTAVIADATLALDIDAFDLPHQTPLVGGAASASLEPIADIVNEPVAAAPALSAGKSSPAQRAAALAQDVHETHDEESAADRGNLADGDDEPQRVAQPSVVREETGDRINMDTGEIPVVTKPDGRLSADPNDPDVAKAIRHEHMERRKASRTKRRWLRVVIVCCTVVALLAGAVAGWGAYRWSQEQYYVGIDGNTVAIYQGVPTDVFGLQLSRPVHATSLKVAQLPQSWRDQLREGITVHSYDEAVQHVALITKEMHQLKQNTQDGGDQSADQRIGAAGDAANTTNNPSDTGADAEGNTSDTTGNTNNSAANDTVAADAAATQPSGGDA